MAKKHELWIGKYRIVREWIGISWTRKSLEMSIKANRKKDEVWASFCAKDFECITGLKLKLGEVRKIKSIKIELKEP